MKHETPLLELDPYVDRFDTREDARRGWLDGTDVETGGERSGGRSFSPGASVGIIVR